MKVRGNFRRIGIVCIFIVVLFAFMIPVCADIPVRRYYYKKNIYASLMKNIDYEIDMERAYPGCSVLSAKSSNTKVLEIVDAAYVSVYVRPKKTGSATIKIKLITAKGKKKTVKTKIKLAKFKKPFKKLVVNGKKLATRMDSGDYMADTSTSKKYAKALVTPAKGWKVKSVTRDESVYVSTGDYTGEYRRVSKKYKISRLPVDSSSCTFEIHLVNKKTKVEEIISLSIQQKE